MPDMVGRRKTALWLATLVILTASATAAFPDGMYKARPSYAPPAFSWTGLYIGGNVGYAWAQSAHCDGEDVQCTGGAPNFPEADPRGAFGGLTAGYNYQTDSIVLGIEGDYNFAHLNATSPSTATFACAGGCTTELENFGTIRARLGYAYWTTLTYFTAGLAITEWRGKFGSPVVFQAGSSTETSAVIGGGFEYAFFPRWSAKIEYLHIFEGATFVYAPAFCTVPGCQIKNEDVDLVRLGINMHLN
jgi:outer membrane immunogenic protein